MAVKQKECRPTHPPRPPSIPAPLRVLFFYLALFLVFVLSSSCPHAFGLLVLFLAGFTEFVAASLNEGQVKKDENLRLAFDHLDSDDTGKITLDNLLEFMGGKSDELTIGEEITDANLHDALIGKGGDGLSYDVVSRVVRGR